MKVKKGKTNTSCDTHFFLADFEATAFPCFPIREVDEVGTSDLEVEPHTFILKLCEKCTRLENDGGWPGSLSNVGPHHLPVHGSQRRPGLFSPGALGAFKTSCCDQCLHMSPASHCKARVKFKKVPRESIFQLASKVADLYNISKNAATQPPAVQFCPRPRLAPHLQCLVVAGC